MAIQTKMPHALSSMLLLLCLCPTSQACPQGFNSHHGRCLLVNSTVSVRWCDANRACAELGAELVTNITVIQNLGSIAKANVWIGGSDIANERERNKDGWQFVNGKGIIPNSDWLWLNSDPDNSGNNQDCMLRFYQSESSSGMYDKQCDYTSGYVCELPDVSPTVSCSNDGGRIRWIPAPAPTPGVFNEANMYCYTERYNVLSLSDCAMLAGMRTYSRSFLYNKDLSVCHVVEFSDSQTKLEQTPTSWVKFIRG